LRYPFKKLAGGAGGRKHTICLKNAMKMIIFFQEKKYRIYIHMIIFIYENKKRDIILAQELIKNTRLELCQMCNNITLFGTLTFYFKKHNCL